MKRIGIQAVDQSGTAGNIAIFEIEFDSTPPVAPNIPDLLASSDTGSSSTDNITRDQQPVFDLTGIEPRAVVQLFRDGMMVAEATAGANGGSVTLADTGGLAGAVPFGEYSYTALQIDRAGNVGSLSAPLVVRITDIDDPALDPNVPILLTSSDTGASSTDGITSDNTPTFQLNVSGGQQIRLFRRPAGTTQAYVEVGAPDASGLITDLGPNGSGLPDGSYEYAARANNTFSFPIVVTIDTVTPGVPGVPDLVSASDNGSSDVDNITSVSNPVFTIGGLEQGTTVRLYRQRTSTPVNATPKIIATMVVGASGTVTIQDVGPLADGDYEFSADQIDIAGNTSSRSAVLTVLIRGSVIQPPPVTLALAPADDTGVPGDNLTANQRPRLIGTTSPNATVILVDGNDNPLAAPVQVGPTGSFTLQFPSNLADGTYTVRARVVDQADNASLSGPLVLTIDATAPAGIANLNLSPESDSGLKGDLRTSVRRPFLTGTTEPGAFVEIFAVGQNVALVSGTADSQGNFRLQVPGQFSNGTVGLVARARDIAGNSGVFGPQANLSIETSYGDYDNDGRADLALYRPGTANGDSQFLVNRSTLGGQAIGSTTSNQRTRTRRSSTTPSFVLGTSPSRATSTVTASSTQWSSALKATGCPALRSG